MKKLFGLILLAVIVGGVAYFLADRDRRQQILRGPALLRHPALLRNPVTSWRLLRAEPPQTLPIPVKGVRPRSLRDSWGGARPGGRKHEGIDIFARRGTPVVSTTDGVVTAVGMNKLGGRIALVFGPGGERHYYAHLDRWAAIRKGDRVQAGTVLGYVGNSGNARGTRPHLHYAIYRPYQGAVNPYPRLATRR